MDFKLKLSLFEFFKITATKENYVMLLIIDGGGEVWYEHNVSDDEMENADETPQPNEK